MEQEKEHEIMISYTKIIGNTGTGKINGKTWERGNGDRKEGGGD